MKSNQVLIFVIVAIVALWLFVKTIKFLIWATIILVIAYFAYAFIKSAVGKK